MALLVLFLKYAALVGVSAMAIGGTYFWRFADDSPDDPSRRKLTRSGKWALPVAFGCAVCSLMVSAFADVDAHDHDASARKLLSDVREQCRSIPEQLARRIDEALGKRATPETSPSQPASSAGPSQCHRPRPFLFGDRQIRIWVSDTQLVAVQRAEEARRQLKTRGLDDWVGHLLNPFSANMPTEPSTAHPSGSKEVWVVAVNQVDERRSDEFCAWLKCIDWDSGLLPCELRPSD